MSRPCLRFVRALVVLPGAVLLAAAHAQLGSAPLTAEQILARARQIVRGAETAYISDYVSFAGADATGRVAFAVDTNRGRAGGEHQAEHFVAMYDERTGWVELEGYTEFANTEGALFDYPASPYFDFAGTPYALDSLESTVNGLSLSIAPLEPRMTTASDTTLFSMASAPATLTWRGRTIPGRVIYEYLVMQDENRLARGVVGLLGVLTSGPDFQGLYLTTGGGDFYIHHARASAAASSGNPLTAFWTEGERELRVDEIDFEVADFDPAFGFYRWPASWRVQWRSDCGTAQLSVRSLDHETQTSWITGGFAMRAVEGELVCGDFEERVFGFAELIR